VVQFSASTHHRWRFPPKAAAADEGSLQGMGLRNQRTNTGKTAVKPSAATDIQETVWAPSTGTYLTDGAVLYRVADALSSRRELFLELEDCRTLELILCAARTLAGPGLSTITPALPT
jgi:hypothetical protein